MSKTITMSAKKEFATKCSKLFCFCTLNKMTSTWSKKKKAFASFIKCTRNVSGWMESKISIVHRDLALPFVYIRISCIACLTSLPFYFLWKIAKSPKKQLCEMGIAKKECELLEHFLLNMEKLDFAWQQNESK